MPAHYTDHLVVWLGSLKGKVMSAKDHRRLATKKQRAHVLALQEWRCKDCGIVLIFGQTEFHHVEPHCVGGPTETYNLVALCVPCHRGKHVCSLS